MNKILVFLLIIILIAPTIRYCTKPVNNPEPSGDTGEDTVDKGETSLSEL